MASNSQKPILKATSIIGGAQVIKLVFQIIRSKVFAILLGPSGIGLIGAFTSATGIITSFAGFGVGFSAVREIARGDSTNDQLLITKSILTLRYLTLLLGMIGTAICYFSSGWLSEFTFGTRNYTTEIGYLSIIVLITLVSSSQSALVQGKRKIKDLAKLNIYGSVYGVLIGIPLIYIYSLKAIVPMLIAVELMNLITSWWYVRKIEVVKIKLKLSEFIHISKSYLKLGFAFMASGFITVLATYLIKVIIIREINVGAVGYYQASLALSSIYIGVILDAMGKDYYPRLTTVSENLPEAIKMINDQVQVGLLLALPGLMLTMVLAPFVIKLFYSHAFSLSAEILRWQILGVFLRVIAWPLAYMILAKGMGKVYFLAELTSNLLHVGLIYILIKTNGVVGTGIAFFILYIFYFLLMFFLNKKYFAFSWTKETLKLIFIFSYLVVIIFLIVILFNYTFGLITAIGLTTIVIYYCIKKLLTILDLSNIFQLKNYLIKR